MTTILNGTKVLDFSRVFAGPAATQVLGDLGADIIKVEPAEGDEARYYGVTPEKLAALNGSSPSFLALNRNKRSISLDLRNPEGKAIALRLAREADVVVHNFRPGAMERLGLGYEDLIAINPRLIYAEFSAYGRKGVLAGMGANDLALQAYSGLISITGEPGRPPVRSGAAIVDMHGSLALVIGVLGALLQRGRTGQGQRVETSLLQSAAHLMSYFYSEYWYDGTERAPMGTANHLSVPNQSFPAKDGELVIIASTDPMWQRFSHALDAERLDRPEFKRAFDRRANRVALVEAVSAVTRNMTCDEIIERLGQAKVVAAKVNSVGEAADSPQLDAIGAKLMMKVGSVDIATVASPVLFSNADMTRADPPPAVGEQTDEILAELGFSMDDIARVRQAGAFGPAAQGEAG